METLLVALDFFGVIVFVITGCMVAARRQVDIVGFTLLGTVTGIGGGTLRDLLLGRSPVFWIEEPTYLLVCVLTAILMFFAAHWIHRYQRVILWCDAIGLAVFTVIGTRVAIAFGASMPVCVLMGIMTATFGGIVRDLLSGEPTLVLRKEVYVTATFCGGVVYWISHAAGLGEALSAVVSLMVTFGIRSLAILYDLSLPGYGGREEPASVPSPERNS